MLGSARSRSFKLFGRVVIFEIFQPMWSRYLNVTDGQTTYCGITLLCVAISRGKNLKNYRKLWKHENLKTDFGNCFFPALIENDRVNESCNQSICFTNHLTFNNQITTNDDDDDDSIIVDNVYGSCCEHNSTALHCMAQLNSFSQHSPL